MEVNTSHSAKRPVVALAGNPNIGKTTLFNRLTGMRQRIGNYPGVTVERKSAVVSIDGQEVEVVDLPGTYSLAAASLDELVVVDALSGTIDGFPRPDLVLFVADAGNLQRNLFLATQISDLGIPMVIAANMMDAAKKKGIEVDCKLLSETLNVPVVPLVATRGEGLSDLTVELVKSLEAKPMMNRPAWPEAVEQATQKISEAVKEHCGEQVEPALARRMIFDAKPLAAKRLNWQPAACSAALSDSRSVIEKGGMHPLAAESLLIYRHLNAVLETAVKDVGTTGRQLGAVLDKILLHRVWGLTIFIAMMYVMFQAIYAWAGPLMDLIDAGTGALQGLVAPMLASYPALQNLVVTGVIGGVGGVVIFLPQICILFLFIAILEDSGYMARAAFLMDRLFSWCGLNGKSFIPMLSGYACAVPGVMAARTIEAPKARLTTILTAPLMSCSARLPVYILLIGAFIEPVYGAAWAGFALFAMHLVGLVVAIPVAWVVNKFLLKTPSQPFVLELPEYRLPVFKDVLFRVAGRGKSFLLRAGTVILAMSIIIWALLYFPRPEGLEESVRTQFVERAAETHGMSVAAVNQLLEADAEALPESQAELATVLADDLDNQIAGAYVEQSLMARFGKTLQPIFAPAGYDWKITVGVLASFPAREVIIATLGIIYNLGDEVDEESESLQTTMKSETWQSGAMAGDAVFSIPVVLSILVFFALCMQCGATVATIWRESSWKWAVFTFVYMTTLAWIGAVVTYQVGRLVI